MADSTGGGQATISYIVRIPSESVLQSTATFTGEVVTHPGGITRRGVCGGDLTMTVAGVHWADHNGDGRIDDDRSCRRII